MRLYLAARGASNGNRSHHLSRRRNRGVCVWLPEHVGTVKESYLGIGNDILLTGRTVDGYGIALYRVPDMVHGHPIGLHLLPATRRYIIKRARVLADRKGKPRGAVVEVDDVLNLRPARVRSGTERHRVNRRITRKGLGRPDVLRGIGEDHARVSGVVAYRLSILNNGWGGARNVPDRADKRNLTAQRPIGITGHLVVQEDRLAGLQVLLYLLYQVGSQQVGTALVSIVAIAQVGIAQNSIGQVGTAYDLCNQDTN